MFLGRKSTVLLVSLLLLSVGARMGWQYFHDPFLEWWWRRSNPGLLPSSSLAFQESYLNAAAGITSSQPTECRTCHPLHKDLPESVWKRLKTRDRLPRAKWAIEIQLQARCGSCHLTPDPSTLPWQSWSDAFAHMQTIMRAKHVPLPTQWEWEDLVHFYYTFSPAAFRPLEPDPDPEESPIQFQAQSLGKPLESQSEPRPIVSHVEIASLDPSGPPGILVCDAGASAVSWIHPSTATNQGWDEQVLARLPYPAQAHLVPGPPKRAPDVVVACLGTLKPCDDLVGEVNLLVNDGSAHFTARRLLDHCSRVADVAAADLDGDGDTDILVAQYGYLNQGEVGWLENQGTAGYVYHQIVQKTGAINVLPIDLDHDGRLDFVALFAQEHEEISAFINTGRGTFTEHVLFKAATPAFGSSGIQLVDLDGDGDLDILYTNGDNMDLHNFVPRPFQGVQWLENKGHLQFDWHDIHRLYGAYCATVGDLNGDGHPDVIVTSLFNDWSDPRRASLFWFENDGHQHFRAHAVARAPIHLVSAAAVDLDGDGRLDIVAAGMNAFPPFERAGRVVAWKNLGAKASAAPASASNSAAAKGAAERNSKR